MQRTLNSYGSKPWKLKGNFLQNFIRVFYKKNFEWLIVSGTFLIVLWSYLVGRYIV